MEATVKESSAYHGMDNHSTRTSSVDTTAVQEHTLSQRQLISSAKLYGRPVKDIIPAHHQSFSEEWQHKAEAAEHQAQQTLKSSEEYYNQHAHTLQKIQIGSNVAIHNNITKLWDIYGIVITD